MSSVSPPRFQDSGTSQQGRRQPLLLERQVLLADYTTEELLAYVAHFSKLVRYYEAKDGRVETTRTWNLGKERSLLIIALIATQRLPAQYEHYTRLVSELRDTMASPAQRQQAMGKILDRIYKMASEFDKWYEAHRRSHTRRTFQAELTAATEDLTQWLHKAVGAEQQLIAYHGLPPRPAQSRSLQSLSAIWHMAAPAGPLPEAERRPLEKLKDEVVDVLWEFHKAQSSLAALAHRVLIRGLRREADVEHDMLPEMSLLITFLELYQHAQDTLNHIPRRHLDYYYQQVLRVAFHHPRPDHAFLTFGLAKGVTSHRLPAGTEVEGGKDADGNRAIFRTVQDEQLSAWRVQQLSSVFVSGHGTDAVKGIYLSTQAPTADSPGPPQPSPAGWAPFGEDQNLISPAYRTMADATVGFAVSAAVLLLQEGRRTIELSLRCEPDSVRRFTRGLEQTGQTLHRAFDALALSAFRIDVTGAEGWLPLRIEEVSLDQDTITWHLSLGREQAAIVPHQPELHADQFCSAWPVLRLVLNARAPHYAYSSFSRLQPLRLGLRVRAQDVQGVQLSNQLGPLTPGMPFAPFGPQARAGSYLLVSFAELFRKRLTSLILTLDWAQLPLDADGFADYYQGYAPPVTNDSFRVAVSYRRDWRWEPETLPLTTRTLFQTLPDSTRRSGTVLLPTTHFALATATTADFRQQPAPSAGSRPNEAATGAIRVELVEPAAGFGADQYSTLLVETMQYNARNAARARPLPRAPFTPLVQSLWLSYAAEEELDMASLFGPASATRPQFYHLHPLASYQPARPVAPRLGTSGGGPKAPRHSFGLGLLPDFAAEGTLYVGLTDVVLPQTISLLFELAPFVHLPYQPPPGAAYLTKAPDIRWHYLAQDEWRPFASGTTLRHDVIHDQSKDFTELKPVYLTLPADVDTQHTVMPSGLCWLRATVTQGVAFVSRVRAVHTQVVAAVRIGANPELPVPFTANLPAFDLSRLVKPSPALARVTQPLPSFGGRPAESYPEYNTRVSERLRHRGRAITAWDYEHLVLENFPEVYRARCLRANQLPASAPRRPGLLMVMVMPFQPTATTVGYRLPTFSPGRLARIRSMLRQVASPHVHLEVCNPLYEVIQVRCRVRFTREARGSHPQPGVLIGQMQHAISEFLSPWNQLNARRQGLHYGLTSSTILSFLNQLPYVEFITAFSVVKMALEDDQYLFYDTEAPDGGPPAEGQPQLLEDIANRPWSVYVSAIQHHIEDISTVFPPEPPAPARPTGIGQLTIGGDFVIPRGFEVRPDASSAHS